MVTTRQITESTTEIAEQIHGIKGRILSAILVVDEPALPEPNPITDAEFAELMAELDSLAVNAPHADDSREAMYTRMPDE